MVTWKRILRSSCHKAQSPCMDSGKNRHLHRHVSQKVHDDSLYMGHTSAIRAGIHILLLLPPYKHAGARTGYSFDPAQHIVSLWQRQIVFALELISTSGVSTCYTSAAILTYLQSCLLVTMQASGHDP